jgi:hypothetical protein
VNVCCLNNYKDDYVIGGFATNITNELGVCGAEIQSKDTTGMFDPSASQSFVADLMTNYPSSAVHATGSGTFHLSLAANDVQSSFSKRVDFPDGHYELKFFLGMAYITMLPAPILSTTASQVQITVSVSPMLTFAFSSQQKYTFVQYLTMAVYQNKWIDVNLVSHAMQFVSMAVVMPTGLLQNMQTGLVPLNSIRFAVAKFMPDKTQSELWTNPCYSGTASGMYDDGQLWENMYKNAAAQTCAFARSVDFSLICLGLLFWTFTPCTYLSFFSPEPCASTLRCLSWPTDWLSSIFRLETIRFRLPSRMTGSTIYS